MGDVETGGGAQATRRNLRFEVAQELFDGIPEIAEDITARPSGHSSVEFLEALVGGETPEEAITFSAYNLPRRYAVWWGHECLRRLDSILEDTDREMLDLAAAWVANPDEQTRYAALDAAMEAKDKTPGVWVAFGAGWSGGSMVGPDLPAVPAAPHLTAKAINASILTILAKVDLAERASILGSFVRMSLQLADGN